MPDNTDQLIIYVAKNVFEFSQEPIVVLDPQGIVEAVNKAFTKLTSYAPADIVGMHGSILRSGNHPAIFYENIWKSISGDPGHWQGEITSRDKNGRIFSEWMTVYRIDDEQGNPKHYVGTFSSGARNMYKHESMSKMATHDLLTGLPNRALLEDRLDHSISTCRRHDRRLAVMFVDIDNFSVVNEKLGHNIGDMILNQSSSRLRHCLRDVDTIARIGGDEFIIVIEDCGPNQATVVSERIMNQLKDEFELDGNNLSITGSIGVAFFPEDGESPEQLIRAADAAMHRAKEFGNGQIEVFRPDLKSQILRKGQIESDLKRAITNGLFDIVYQPKFNIQSARMEMVGVECLARWCSESFGFISPSEFIPVAESTGLIRKFDEVVISKILTIIAKWEKLKIPFGKVAFNISAHSLKDEGFATKVVDMVNEKGIDPKSIQIEVTESILIDHAKIAYDNLYTLCNAGIQLSIDDFGTGYSSLNYLKKLPFKELKIDKSFIDGLGSDPEDEAITTAILDIARALNMATVAEGIETDTQLAWLMEAGSAQGQGYFLAKPLTEAELVSFIKNGSTCCRSRHKSK